MRNSQSLNEREYYFDEGLGQSLNEHVKELQERHPDAKIETRRDRDGFSLVKVSSAPQYKYELD